MEGMGREEGGGGSQKRREDSKLQTLCPYQHDLSVATVQVPGVAEVQERPAHSIVPYHRRYV